MKESTVTGRSRLIAAGPLEALEPRRLLSSYTFEPFVRGLGLDPTLLDLAAGGAVSLASIGDVDGDGADDLLVGFTSESGGLARAYSGRTGQTLFEHTDSEAEFGFSVAGLGDLTGDGTPDYAVGSPAADEFGRVFIYSGADGSIVRSFQAPIVYASPNNLADRFGHAIAPAGDIDGDGTPDLLVGAPGAGPSDQGQVFILSGATGDPIRELTGEDQGDEFGFSLAATGILPGDGGAAGILIGAPGRFNPEIPNSAEAGAVFLFDIATGDLIRSFAGTQAGARMGHAVAAARHADTVILYFGAPGYDTTISGAPAADAGRISFVDARWETINHYEGSVAGGRFGTSLAVLPDIDGDGTEDLAIAAPGAATITVAGSSGVEATLPGVLAAGADVDGNGLIDLATISPPAEVEARLVVHSYLTFAPLQGLIAASPDLNFLVYGPSGMLIERGVGVTALSRIPGLNGARIVSINDDGHIVARDDSGVFILIEGQRTNIPGDATQVVGGPLTDGPFTVAGINNAGQIILQQTTADNRTVSWLYSDGVLTFLWNGFVSEINNSGVILGTRLDPGQQVGLTVLRAPDGVITEIPGLFAATDLSDDNAVAGIDASGAIVIWQAGATTVVTLPEQARHAQVIDLATDRRMVFVVNTVSGALTIAQPYFFEPGRGPVALRGVITNASSLPDPMSPSRPFPSRIADDGTILTSDGVLLLNDPALETLPAPDAPRIPLTVGDTVTTITINAQGELIAARVGSDGRSLGVSRIYSTSGNLPIVVQGNVFTAFVDPRSGGLYVVVGINGGAALYRLSDNAANATFERHFVLFTSSEDSSESPWASDLVVFTSAEEGGGRVHLAGRHISGDWVMFYQTGAPDPLGRPSGDWAVTNLTDEHLAPQGLTLPDLTGITTYVTPWNALNIVGIDADGQLHALWWAPGLEGGLWRADNLSAAIPETFDVPAFDGNLTAFVTPWNAIHIAATARTSGELFSVWWAPGFEQAWRIDTLASPDGAPALVPGSLTSLTTPWGGLTIAGIAAADHGDIDAGEIAVFWWSPATPSEENPSGWNTDSLTDAAATPDSPPNTPPTAQAPLAAITTASGAQHVFSTAQSSGHLLAFTWTPAHPIWTYVDFNAASIT